MDIFQIIRILRIVAILLTLFLIGYLIYQVFILKKIKTNYKMQLILSCLMVCLCIGSTVLLSITYNDYTQQASELKEFCPYIVKTHEGETEYATACIQDENKNNVCTVVHLDNSREEMIVKSFKENKESVFHESEW